MQKNYDSQRIRNLRKAKAKFIADLNRTRYGNDSNRDVKDRINDLISQAKNLADFLLNKHREHELQEEMLESGQKKCFRDRRKKLLAKKKAKQGTGNKNIYMELNKNVKMV